MVKENGKKKNSPPEGFAKIEWHVSENLAKRYATNFVIRHTENEFNLSFFDVDPPIILGTEEEARKKLNAVKSVRANCVSSIIVTPDKIPGLIEALQANYGKYVDKTLKESPNKKVS